MSKYNFGYEITDNETNQWAFDLVESGSRVLELGASIGALTRNLKERKQCMVDIVEIDENAGAQAAMYADTSIIGADGDLNNNTWFNLLEGRSYDYIIALDVLEHLLNPHHVLSSLKGFLSPAGKILLSIPNICHNSVIIEQLLNRFDYTDLGLLDNTHTHFFSRASLRNMINSCELYVVSEDAVIREVGNNEIDNSYLDIPESVTYALRTRPFGTLYQQLYVLSVDSGASDSYHELEASNFLNLYKSIVLINGLQSGAIFYESDLKRIHIRIDLTAIEGVSSIRFVPVKHNCFVYNLHVCGIKDGTEEALAYNWTTGFEIQEELILFYNTACEINYQLMDAYDSIEITCGCQLLFKDMRGDLFKGLQNTLHSLRAQHDHDRKEIEALLVKKNELEQTIDKLVRGSEEQTCSVFYDTGDGWNDVQRYTYTYTLDGITDVSFNVDLSGIEGIQGVRIDPCEGRSVKCKDFKACMDSNTLAMAPLNAFATDSGYDYFITPDPIYTTAARTHCWHKASASDKQSYGAIAVQFQLEVLQSEEIDSMVRRHIGRTY